MGTLQSQNLRLRVNGAALKVFRFTFENQLLLRGARPSRGRPLVLSCCGGSYTFSWYFTEENTVVVRANLRERATRAQQLVGRRLEKLPQLHPQENPGKI